MPDQAGRQLGFNPGKAGPDARRHWLRVIPVDMTPECADHHHVHPLPHGYTNKTAGNANGVTKTYLGPDAPLRLARERRMLRALHSRMPVPEIYATWPDGLTLQFLPGTHGQDLIGEGHARPVLRACGELLRTLQGTPAADVGLAGTAGQVLVHGDFGPNNVLLDPATYAVTALLDWEFAHLGDPVEDLAWCEWIIRAHHPGHRSALEDFFTGYGGPVPAWPERKAAIVTRCRQLEQFCQRWEPNGPGAAMWDERAAVAAKWRP